jgi:hypothetical protein
MRADERAKARAAEFKKSNQATETKTLRNTVTKAAPATTTSSATKTAANTTPVGALVGSRAAAAFSQEQEIMQARLQVALQEIATLRDENEALRKSQASSSARPSLPHSMNVLAAGAESSVPFIRHRLRMAEAEPALSEMRLAYYMKDFQRLDKLQQKGVVSQEEYQKAKAQVQIAEAELRKAQVEIESLKKLLIDLEKDAGSKGLKK